jgi:hypothetical protein
MTAVVVFVDSRFSELQQCVADILRAYSYKGRLLCAADSGNGRLSAVPGPFRL